MLVFAAALVVAVTSGIVVEYACGILGLMAMVRMSLAQALAATRRVRAEDLLKAVATAFVTEASHRSYPAGIVSRL
ncbi:biotin transporter BioY [Bradyrhizobium sp. USDA 4449]